MSLMDDHVNIIRHNRGQHPKVRHFYVHMDSGIQKSRNNFPDDGSEASILTVKSITDSRID
jgi:hypothetical protein